MAMVFALFLPLGYLCSRRTNRAGYQILLRESYTSAELRRIPRSPHSSVFGTEPPQESELLEEWVGPRVSLAVFYPALHLQHGLPTPSSRSLQAQMIRNLTQVVEPPEAFRLALGVGSCGCIPKVNQQTLQSRRPGREALTNEPRHPKRPIHLDRLAGARHQQLLDLLGRAPLDDGGGGALVPAQRARHGAADHGGVGDGLAAHPEGVVHGGEGGGQGGRARELQRRQRALGGDGVGREARRRGGEHGDGEDARPAEALGVDPFVLVCTGSVGGWGSRRCGDLGGRTLDLDGRGVVAGFHYAAQEDGDVGYLALLEDGEVLRDWSADGITCGWRVRMCREALQDPYLQRVESKVGERRNDVDIELDLRLRHDATGARISRRAVVGGYQ